MRSDEVESLRFALFYVEWIDKQRRLAVFGYLKKSAGRKRNEKRSKGLEKRLKAEKRQIVAGNLSPL